MILISNVGSSSRKYALFDDAGEGRFSARVEQSDQGALATYTGEAPVVLPEGGYEDFLMQVRAKLSVQGIAPEQITRIGVRVVAPGAYFAQHRVIDDAYCAALAGYHAIDPIHVLPVLQEIGALRTAFPEALLVAVSDSAFHATLPQVARTYGIPRELAAAHEWYRFGYHGLSVSAAVAGAARVLGEMPERLVVCHLGSGSSVTAVRKGISVDTTMGYTPLEGVTMATRSGNLDPGIVLEMVRTMGSVEAVRTALYESSGLRGIGGSADLRELLTREAAGEELATETIAVLVRSVQKAIYSMVASLGGIDTLVITGTIGERSATVRAKIVTGLSGLGLTIDTMRNEAIGDGEGAIQQQGAAPVIILHTREERTAFAIVKDLAE